MAFHFREYDLRGLTFGSDTMLREGVLTMDRNALVREVLSRDQRIASVDVHLARPGESKRILCVKDVIEPRFKESSNRLGSGSTHALKNVAVVTCGPIVAFQEGIIDMSGPGADHSPFSNLLLIVVEMRVTSDTNRHQHEAIVRESGLWVAEYLAATSGQLTPDRTREIIWNGKMVDPHLPRIAYVDMVLSQGLLHDTYVLGRNAMQGLPRIMDPGVILDGGVVSGNCVSACDKHTTFHHQNNPVIHQLLAGHSTDWNFVGVVMTNASTRLAAKQQAAEQTVKLVRQLNADGVVISKEGFGNPDADLMMLIRDLELSGIKTVAITDEFAGPLGDSQSLADSVPQADAIVSVGNANQPILLPPMETVIGPLPDVSRLAGGYAHSLRKDGSMRVELQAMIGSTNQMGFGHLSCRGL